MILADLSNTLAVPGAITAAVLLVAVLSWLGGVYIPGQNKMFLTLIDKFMAELKTQREENKESTASVVTALNSLTKAVQENGKGGKP